MPDIAILYEDADCVVVNKPAGLMVHPDGRSEGPFLTDWIAARFPETVGIGEPGNGPDGEPLARGGIVHRLDKETSGALIVARTTDGFAALKKQFQGREVAKKYLAFVWGEMKENFGTIDRPIGRSSTDFRKRSAQRGARGELREAETYWTRIWTGQLEAAGLKGVSVEKFSLVEAEPKTGRTHQIRAHLNAVNHPIVGDTLYAPKRPMALGFERLALHSREISFDALGGGRVRVVAPLPADFAAACVAVGADILDS